MSEDLRSQFTHNLLTRELAKMEAAYGPDALYPSNNQHYIYAKDFKDESSGDTKNKGAPILAYSFLGYGTTHHPTGDPGTRYPVNILVYGYHDDLLPMIQHLHGQKATQQATWIGLETFNHVNTDYERRTRYVFIFYGAMIYNMSSTGHAYIIFYNVRNYEVSKIIAGDQDPKGTIMIRCTEPNNPKATASLDEAAKANAAA